MEDKVIEKTEKYIEEIIKQDLDSNNLENLYKLSKIKHMAKEDKEMNYGNYNGYGNYGNYGRGNYGESYGNYGNYGEGYGRRGYDSKYRGYEHLDRMAGDYGRYMESRERYGAGEDTDKAHQFMVKSLGEYVKYLYDEAQTPQQKQMITETLQRYMR